MQAAQRHCCLCSLLRGGAVDGVIGKGPHDGRFSAQEVKPLFRRIATALAALHEAGLAHCDVKPDNLMLAKADVLDSVVVVDFGCARPAGALASHCALSAAAHFCKRIELPAQIAVCAHTSHES